MKRDTGGVSVQVRPGMRVQLERWRAALAAGAGRAGWKIGFNDPKVQRRFGLDAPVVGYLTADRVVADGATHHPPAAGKLAIEAEIAVTIGRSLGANATPQDAARAISAIAPALELVDYARPAGDLDAILTNDVFHEAVVFGSPASVALRDLPAALAVRLTVNAVEKASMAPELVPGSFAELVCLVARVLAAHGEVLAAGDRIITGSLIQPVSVARGDHLEARIDPLGSVSLRLAA